MLYVKQTWLETVHKTLEAFFPVLSCWPQFCMVHVITLCAQLGMKMDEGLQKIRWWWVCPSVKMTIPILNHFELPFRSASPCRPCLYPGLYLSQAPPAVQQVLSCSFATMRTDEPKWIPITIWQSHTISSFSYFCCKKCRLNCCKNVYSYLCYPKKSLTELVSSPWQPCDAPLFRGAAALSFLQRLHSWTIGKRCWNIDMSCHDMPTCIINNVSLKK